MLKTTFTLAEAADLLSCHSETLRRAIKEGTLRAAKLGREYRISRSDLQAFWSSRGGWDLFGDGEVAEAPPPPKQTGTPPRKKKESPKQFSLLGQEE